MAKSSYRFKILLLGDSAVGKTTLVNKFIQGKFSADYKMTIGVDIMTKTLNIDGTEVVLSIWDIAGQDRFRSFRSVFYRGASGALVVFDLTRLSSFQNLDRWVSELLEFVGRRIPLVFIGNKADLANMRMVKDSEAINYVKKLNSTYKTGQGVDECFTVLSKLALNPA